MSTFSNLYPYTDEHNLNLDWIIKEVTRLGSEMGSFKANNTITYKGVWNISNSYSAWDVVAADDYTYIAKKPIPAGTDINNADYWSILSPITVDTEARALIDEVNARITSEHNHFTSEITATNSTVSVLNGEVVTLDNKVTSYGNEIDHVNTSLGRVITKTAANTSDIQTERAARTAADATLNTRIDNIVSGAAVDPDAELIDVRVGADGKTYASAGNSVRGQIGTIRNTDIFNMADFTGKYFFYNNSNSSTEKSFTAGHILPFDSYEEITSTVACAYEIGNTFRPAAVAVGSNVTISFYAELIDEEQGAYFDILLSSAKDWAPGRSVAELDNYGISHSGIYTVTLPATIYSAGVDIYNYLIFRMKSAYNIKALGMMQTTDYNSLSPVIRLFDLFRNNDKSGARGDNTLFEFTDSGFTATPTSNSAYILVEGCPFVEDHKYAICYDVVCDKDYTFAIKSFRSFWRATIKSIGQKADFNNKGFAIFEPDSDTYGNLGFDLGSTVNGNYTVSVKIFDITDLDDSVIKLIDFNDTNGIIINPEYISKNDSDLNGKKFVIYGDSISTGSLYPDTIHDYFNFNLVNNSIGGTTIAYNDEDSFSSDSRIETIPYDADVVMIMGGTNDFGQTEIEEEITYQSGETKTVEGASVSFSDAKPNTPFLSVIADIEATQSGSGTPSPDNPRPINGFSSVIVTAGDGTHTIALGQTVGKGTLNITTGELTITHKIKIYDGSEGWTTSSNQWYFASLPTNMDIDNRNNSISNYGVFTSPNNNLFYGGSGLYVQPFFAGQTLEQFKTSLSENNMQVLYKLANPEVIQLTPEEIRAISGLNTVSANSGEIEITYLLPDMYDRSKFKGAIVYTIDKIQKHVPDAKIILCTQVNSRGTAGQKQPLYPVDSRGQTPLDFRNAEIEAAAFMSIDVIDTWSCGINGMNRDIYIEDSVHPSGKGVKLIADYIISKLRSLKI